jgi:hypothetical protein
MFMKIKYVSKIYGRGTTRAMDFVTRDTGGKSADLKGQDVLLLGRSRHSEKPRTWQGRNALRRSLRRRRDAEWVTTLGNALRLRASAVGSNGVGPRSLAP